MRQLLLLADGTNQRPTAKHREILSKKSRAKFYILYIFAASILIEMKKNELTRKLEANGCYLCRNGANHEIWYSPVTKVRFPVPRHGGKEMATTTVMKICKQSGVKLF